MPAAPSPYEPLPSSRSIRLLKVAIFEDSNIFFHIHTAGLDDEAVDFDALSYTWGTPIDTPSAHAAYGPNNDVEVVLSSNTARSIFKIGRNLYEAVLDISKRSHRALWIDAVCINQADVDEKTHQVGIMGDIYSKASRTLVWLGIDDRTRPIFHHIRYIHGTFFDDLIDAAKEAYHVFPAWEHLDDPASDLVLKLGTRTMRLHRQAIDALYYLYLTRTYFRRVWVVQEVYLGDALVTLDGQLFNFVRFSIIAGMLANSKLVWVTYGMAGKYALGLGLSTMNNEIVNVFATHDVEGAYDTRQLQRTGNSTPAYFDIMVRLRLLQTSMKEATDARDYLFAFHSIAKALSGAEGFAPNYRLNTQEAYYAFTCEALKHSLEVLTLAQGSWVPDYANTALPALAVAPFLDVCAGGSFQPVVIGENQTLFVAAQLCSSLAKSLHFPFTMDAVASRDRAFSRGIYDIYVQALHFLQDCGVNDAESLFRVMTMKLESTTSDFRAQMSGMAKMLVLDLAAAGEYEAVSHLLSLLPSFDHMPDIKVLLDIGQRWWDWLLKESQVDRESLDPDISQLMHDKPWFPQFLLSSDEVFFMTKDGHFGRTVAGAAQQDELWLLRGARAPFVLRKKGNKTYTLIGEAVLSGVMFGEKTVDGILSPTETIGILR